MTVSADNKFGQTLYKDITLPSGKSYKQPTGLFINNEFVHSHLPADQVIPVHYPATNEKVCSVEIADKDTDVNLAVEAAHTAFKTSWKNYSVLEKRECFLKLANLVNDNLQLLAEIESIDTGKSVSNTSIHDMGRVVDCLKYYGGWIDKMCGQSFIPSKDKICYTYHQPIGVVGCIIPFNYPLSLMAWKWAAIAVGNTTVFKAGDQTPLSILYFASLVAQAGFPPGVFNVINGYGQDVGDALVKHPKVSKVAFTGSTIAAKIIQQNCSSQLKACSLEAGGKSPIVIYKDCNMDQAIKWACVGIFSNTGQVCSGTSRCYVEEEVYEEFLQNLKKYMEENYIIGDPFDPKTVVGPVINKIQFDRVTGFIQSGIDEGCRLVAGGVGKPECITKNSNLQNGFYVQPTIFADVEKHHTISHQEIFGPVIAVAKFSSANGLQEIIDKCNDSPYGLGASIFTQDITRANVFAREVESGQVWINSSNDVDMNVPFHGVKESGLGHELGSYGLENFTTVKSVHLTLADRL
ncbi:hypothetical protein ACO0RG_001262 [Hanseniaspora osmophila]|uniref:Putative aldehyde dehydrogenase-like protein n=1 Tax=Hanseniaspora osmophila TaxID=56408 RepID=A0A1E5RNL6_9ASCO|nr:putative aldehyde dehydrogenase-like protein [Hanseniaspora osmophila]